MAVPALAAGVLLLAGSPAFAADTAPIYKVTQEGMTADQGAKLADAFGIPNSVQPNGAFAFTAKNFGAVPQKAVGEGKDEAGRATTSLALDTAALDRLKPLSDAAALERAGQLVDLAGLSPDLKAEPSVSNTELTTSDAKGETTGSYALDTAVSYKLTLNGLPVTGQGAKLRITLDGDGSVTQLSESLRSLQRGDEVPIVSPDAAQKNCAALYGGDVRQAAPTLGYLMPPLGSVQAIYPVYTCNPSTETGDQAHRQVPAVLGAAPAATLRMAMKGDQVSAAVAPTGGTAPYSYKWSSSSTVLDPNDGSRVSYQRTSRSAPAGPEAVTVEVTDANGLSSTATATLDADGSVSKASTPGGGGFGKLAIGPVDVGIENMVDEWQCAQDSATGFRNVMGSHGIATAFDFRGMNAWEEDFKKGSLGGTDSTFADNVDAQWYTGHGWSGGFTFKNTAHDDGSIVPSDADWGNGDLEWLQLESCQVLRDTTGTNDYFSRWGGAINGLHMLNGFDTSAYCIGGGTGADFAQYLFPQTFLGFTIRPALTVRQAWGQMAIDKEPSGVKYRSMGNIGPGGVTNIGDHFWGQGSTGPDISRAGRTGMWAISGVV
jgi:hypothetical protein